MILGIVLLVVVIIYFLISTLVFKEYNEVEANYETLLKVLDTRDVILLRILPEIKSKRTREEMTKLVSDRMEAKKKGTNEIIRKDVELNKHLKPIYDEINISKNPLVKEEFRRIIRLEKSLKNIRREYTASAEKYNEKFIKHPKLFLKYLRMKPLDTYNIKTR